MRWDAVIPGQPLSTNHIYRRATRQATRKGVPQFRADGEPVVQRFNVLTDEAEAYRDGAQIIFQTRRPSAFRPAGQIRVMLDLFLGFDIDDDNILKLIYDALKVAIGIDDKHFLHCIRTKEIGHDRPYVIVTVDDDPRHR